MTNEKPLGFALPLWDSNEPRFIVVECEQCGDDRKFQNNQCVYNQRLGFAYSVDEIVEVLNNTTAEETYNIIRKMYHAVKQDSSDIFTKKGVLAILGYIAEIGEVDLKEYPKINIKDLLERE